MAWIEQTGTHSWRVRYRRPTGPYATIAGFTDKTTARNYASDLDTDRRRGTWIDPAAGHTALAAWVEQWLPSLDVEIRTEENYRAYLRNHILPRWGLVALGDITALDVTTWLKQLRVHYAASTVRTIRSVFSMLRTTPSSNASSPEPDAPPPPPRPRTLSGREGIRDARTRPTHRGTRD
jgi:hypothetical protein